MPFYASAEQIMRDRAEYARKGIMRGRPVVVLTYADGVLFVAENPPSTLHKVGEIYDRIGFAAVGRYSEFEKLRVAGIRLADMRGYSYDRRDVTGRALANAYAQTLDSIFTEQQKPYEVELCVAEVGATPAEDRIYRLHFDGSIVDEPGYVVLGGQARADRGRAQGRLPGRPAAGRGAGAGHRALGTVGADNGKPRDLAANQLEVAVLDRGRPARKFRRVQGAALNALLPQAAEVAAAPTEGGSIDLDATEDPRRAPRPESPAAGLAVAGGSGRRSCRPARRPSSAPRRGAGGRGRGSAWPVLVLRNTDQ